VRSAAVNCTHDCCAGASLGQAVATGRRYRQAAWAEAVIGPNPWRWRVRSKLLSKKPHMHLGATLKPKVLTIDETRRTAVNIAKRPKFLLPSRPAEYARAFNQCLRSKPADYDWIRANCRKNGGFTNAFECVGESGLLHIWFVYESLSNANRCGNR
jgi:hypothetical protein